MFGLFGKKNKDEKEDVDLSRRNFLKGAAVIPAGVVVMAAGSAVASEPKDTTKSDYLKKTWKEDGITYMEYELLPHIQPFFKHPEGRNRAIATPIYNLDKEHFGFTDTPDKKEWVYTKDERKNKFIRKLKTYIEMGQREDPEGWATPYIYIINIKGNDKLFGAMINQKKLEFETNAYTVYG